MTDPQTPATEAGRRHLDWLNAGDDVFPEDARATVIAIEAEARASLDVDVLAMALAAEDGFTDLESWRTTPGQVDWARRITEKYSAILAERKP